MSKCDRVQPELDRLNDGTCEVSSDCGEGETCVDLVNRACTLSSCNNATGAITTKSCAGFCVSGTAPVLTSAGLTNDGRQIALTFDQDVVLAPGAQPRLARMALPGVCVFCLQQLSSPALQAPPQTLSRF